MSLLERFEVSPEGLNQPSINVTEVRPEKDWKDEPRTIPLRADSMEVLFSPRRKLIDITSGWVQPGEFIAYDRLEFEAGKPTPERWPMFSHPMGVEKCRKCGSTHERTVVDTNMLRPNQFPPPKCLIADKILLLFDPSMDKGDRARFAASYRFEIAVDERVKAGALFGRSPAIGTLGDLIEWDNRRINRPVQRIKHDLATEALYIENPFYIAPLQQFSCDVYGTTFVPEKDIAVFVMIGGLSDLCLWE